MDLLGDPFLEVGSFHRKNGIRELMTRLETGEVPTYFVKPLSERRTSERFGDLGPIPCINLQALSEEDLLVAVRDACTTWAIFYLIGHEVPSYLLDDMQRFTKQFFSLPHEEKIQVTTGMGFSGPVHFGGGGNKDWREVLRIHFAPSSDVAREFWPSKPTGFRIALEEYGNHLQELSTNFLKIISRSLGLNEDFLLEACGEAKVSVTVNHAPPSMDASLTMGHQAHFDPNMLTIILQDEVGGLQVYKDDCWVNVTPLKNAFVVNIGDQLQILSNGQYKSCLHRVLNNNHSSRTSTAFFIAPSRITMIGPTPSLMKDNDIPLYPRRLYGEYLDDFYTRSDCPTNNTTHMVQRYSETTIPNGS